MEVSSSAKFWNMPCNQMSISLGTRRGLGVGGCVSMNKSLAGRKSAYHRKWLSEEQEASHSFGEGIPGGRLFGKTFPTQSKND